MLTFDQQDQTTCDDKIKIISSSFSDEIEQDDKSSDEIKMSSDEKNLYLKKLKMERVFFFTLAIFLCLVTIGVLIFCSRVVNNRDNEDIKHMISSLLNRSVVDNDNEDIKQMISSLLNASISDNEDIRQMLSSLLKNRSTRSATDQISTNLTTNLTSFNYNNTNCPYQFPLYDDRRVSVCLNSTLVDIRQFLNDRPTVKGLNLTRNDWLKLVSLMPYISAALLLVL